MIRLAISPAAFRRGPPRPTRNRSLAGGSSVSLLFGGRNGREAARLCRGRFKGQGSSWNLPKEHAKRQIARDLQKAGAGLRSIAEPVVDTTSDFAELVLAMLGVAAKLERRRIKERTERGRADAKAKGVKFGRKPKLTEHQRREAIKRRDQNGEIAQTPGDIALGPLIGLHLPNP